MRTKDNCTDEDTHYAGCPCHEARMSEEVETWKARAEINGKLAMEAQDEVARLRDMLATKEDLLQRCPKGHVWRTGYGPGCPFCARLAEAEGVILASSRVGARGYPPDINEFSQSVAGASAYLAKYRKGEG